MPTRADSGSLASKKPLPVAPTDRPVGPMPPPVKPAFTSKPFEPPHPVLQSIGFQGGIQEFNQRTQAAVEAHQHAMGKDPTPGLVMDLVRSPLTTDQFSSLFTLSPHSPTQARLALEHQKVKQDYEFFIQRPDGQLQADNPISRMIQGTASSTQPDLRSEYPWIAEGFLPVNNLGDLYRAANEQASAPISHGGMSLEQFKQEYLRANPLMTPDQAERAASLRTESNVKTITDAQTELNKLMGTSLPVTGIFNEDWAKTLSNYTKTKQYYQKATEFIASQHNMSVPNFIKAWTNQQSRPAYVQYLAKNLPVQLFLHEDLSWGALGDIYHYLRGTSNNPVDIALHGLTRSAGLGLTTVGGTIDQAKIDIAASNAFLQKIALEPPTNETFAEAKARMSKVLRSNPSWIRVFDPSFTTEPKGATANLDLVTNVLGDLILLRKASLTGESLKYGDLAKASKSPYVKWSASWAHKELLRPNGVGRAAAMMEGGDGAEKLAAVAAPLIRRGLMSSDELRTHLAELVSRGETTIVSKGKEIQIRGAALGSIKSKTLPTPGVAGRIGQDIRRYSRHIADSMDGSAKNVPFTDSAESFVRLVRTNFAHNVSLGRHNLFDPRLPERIHDFTLSKFKDVNLANKWESDFVTARAHENISKMNQVFEDMQKAFHDKFPSPTGMPPQQEFDALLKTELRGQVIFPSGEEKYMQGVEASAKRMNNKFLRLGQLHAQVLILSPILGYKHMIDDTLRRFAGGGFKVGLGGTEKNFQSLLKSDPELARRYGSFLDRSIHSETRWLLDRGQAVNRKNFQTSEFFGDSSHMLQAGAYLRRLLQDDSLSAYRASSSSDLTPLVRFLTSDKDYLASIKGSDTYKAALKEKLGAFPLASGETKAGFKKTVLEEAATERAKLIFNRYKEYESAASTSGSIDPWGEASKALMDEQFSAIPNTDRVLGKHIADNKIDFGIEGARPEVQPWWDEQMNTWISRVMYFNRWNRAGMAKNVFLDHYKAAVEAGIAPRNAASIAMDVAEKQTIFHMLDFANRLKIEQDLKWVSYFATKKRLYWKWLFSTFWRHPKYATAIQDVRDHLDNKGNIKLSVHPFGLNLSIPAARLVWATGLDYPSTSPLFGGVTAALKAGVTKGPAAAPQAFLDSAAGTYGNIFSRNDVGLAHASKLALMSAGLLGSTYGNATAGMSDKNKRVLNRAMNEYQIDYFDKHGHYAPESAVVKLTLLKQAGEELNRANAPLMLNIDNSPRQDEHYKLLNEFMGLIEPAKRYKFLKAHPGFSEQFGVSEDPKTFLYKQEFFNKYTKSLDQYRQARDDLFTKVTAQGAFTPADYLEKRQLDQSFQDEYNKLLVEDAARSGLKTEGRIPNTSNGLLGKWGKIVVNDAWINPAEALDKMFPKLDSAQMGKVVGTLQRDLQNELSQMNDPSYAATYTDPQELKNRRREILQQLQVFSSFPKDALGATYHEYLTKYVNPFWTTADQKYQAITKQGVSGVSKADKALAYADLREWKDSQDHPVKVTVQGKTVTFPSPIQMAWATLDPKTRKQRLSGAASGSWSSLASYEKTLLGKQSPSDLSKGWFDMENVHKWYTDTYYTGLEKNQVQSLAKQIDAKYPGFYKDWLFSQQPKIRRLETLNLYQEMPSSDRDKFNQYIGNDARKVASAIASGNYTRREVTISWEKYVKQTIVPWLNDPEQRSLKQFLDPFGPDYLNTLVVK